jgi:hypothetical protein
MQPLFLFQNLARDIRHSVRSLGTDWKFSLVAVLALSLGIGASTIVFSVFYNLLFNAVAAKDADQLVVPVIVNAEQSDSSTGLFVRSSDLTYLKRAQSCFRGFDWLPMGTSDGSVGLSRVSISKRARDSGRV